jgi:hypothetical protein
MYQCIPTDEGISVGHCFSSLRRAYRFKFKQNKKELSKQQSHLKEFYSHKLTFVGCDRQGPIKTINSPIYFAVLPKKVDVFISILCLLSVSVARFTVHRGDGKDFKRFIAGAISLAYFHKRFFDAASNDGKGTLTLRLTLETQLGEGIMPLRMSTERIC